MRHAVYYVLSSSLLCLPVLVQAEQSAPPLILSETAKQSLEKPPAAKAKTAKAFASFTGKVTKNKVRLRLEPSLDSQVIKELNKSDLLVVLGETEDFYAIQAPQDIKGFVFRTYVLDGIVEGNRVNVRLEPDLTAPVIAQLNAGDHVEGDLSKQDKKWLEIAPPESARFYVSKDYVEKIGDASLFSKMRKQKEENAHVLEAIAVSSKTELTKPFEQIELDIIFRDLNKIVGMKGEFPEQAEKAKELLVKLQDGYLEKKLAFIHSKEHLTKELPVAAKPLETANQEVKTVSLESKPLVQSNPEEWIALEQKLYDAWTFNHPESSFDDFYQQQSQYALDIKGTLESYPKPVKNKPGDYLLVNNSNGIPLAYLYSTKVNLHEKLGEKVSIKVVPRENNNFAFPAYFVLSME